MMDIEKLIERLKGKHFERDFDCTPFECGVFGLLDNAADVLSTLQAENEKLRAEVEQVKQAAENDIPHNCHTCKHCSDPMCPGNTTKNSFGFQENCNSWQWRG